MKSLLAYFVVSVLIASSACAQVVDPSLNTDLSFRQALKSVHYPTEAHRPEQMAKLYVDFTVTKEGKVSDVKLLKTGAIDQAFVEEVNRQLAQLPAQKPVYAGDYVLPIVFESQLVAGVYQPTVSERAAYNRTFVQLSHVKILLDELYVAAN